ncbi:FUSC family protein [Bacillus piscicola]|uniref:FUSC family protein n=1 Tax=Bacillus piscicola TaxID=1632684 RepID=UPI001F08DEB6|nr:aromatic acid exporter family protein [Bacillus piscicola]
MDTKKKWKVRVVGGRILKTGIAVFLTALICRLFGMLEAFAVITAIVTLEPTAAASIRKGVQRLPASIIGAALAMGFTYFFDISPLTYTLSALSTIYICTRLKLTDGTLVATLTAVAMIPVSEGHLFYSFLERVGTTTIGLSVSTLVNFIILPPHFSHLIAARNERLFKEVAEVFRIRMQAFLYEDADIKTGEQQYKKLEKEMERSIQLSYYQKDELRYHRRSSKEKRFFTFEQRQLHILERIIYHLHQLFTMKPNADTFTPREEGLVKEAVQSIAFILADPDHRIPEEHWDVIEKIDDQFWQKRESASHPAAISHHHRFSDDVILLFTILYINDELEELEHLHLHETDNQEK